MSDEVKAMQELIEKTSAAIARKRSEAVEALCAVFVEEKGPRAAIDYELVEVHGEDEWKWFFRRKDG